MLRGEGRKGKKVRRGKARDAKIDQSSYCMASRIPGMVMAGNALAK